MQKPDPKNYPPQSPHDLEWGGVNQKYYDDLLKWEKEQENKTPVDGQPSQTKDILPKS